jgi:hypothetical protein
VVFKAIETLYEAQAILWGQIVSRRQVSLDGQPPGSVVKIRVTS